MVVFDELDSVDSLGVEGIVVSGDVFLITRESVVDLIGFVLVCSESVVFLVPVVVLGCGVDSSGSDGVIVESVDVSGVDGVLVIISGVSVGRTGSYLMLQRFPL